MVTLNVLGLNCGTSIDGIDVAHCRISSVSPKDIRIEVLSYTEVPVDSNIRKNVLRLCRPGAGASTTLSEVCDLNFTLGREFARAIHDSGVDLSQVDLIASHGQTLWHNPQGDHRSTLQMAEPSVIAHQTKKTVTSNFRVAELAAGRQGAPLAGFFEACLLADPNLTRISQNIGGMGNASVLFPTSKPQPEGLGSTYMAFDTGPGNVFIDACVRILTDGAKHYDKDGEAGARGESEIDEALVDRYLSSEPYFRQAVPKTTGRELFSDDVARNLVSEMQATRKSPDAIVATMTRITAESIARAYEDFVVRLLGAGGNIDEIYICGGGAYNPNILKHLQTRFAKSRVMRLDDAPVKVDPAAKEAVMFALLGYMSVCGWTIPIAGKSENADPAILGVVTPGDNYHEVMQRVVGDEYFGKADVLQRIIM
ncbi:related to molecular chaperone distantly related to HSP70-fold metalloproteases [Cephalotrichum gorgonifer]|uniref:Related to molecular chaperone distantly related to HSP70-fold metalloproteases n=1 Tax=Cephalotrichum gorgonifer TaxID=2041049 RepID=A0AAE8SWE5_9PEZI|nr:related to molecular chaperone distantly related to HSP70-fold metalloproteases [Cephalotrichum gorgonifer]